ncbi:MAG: hypothetical protein HY951_06140 [Bacteroidia bacterium]|nr:hypothetical protein [Bacteroidia bacterium]
MQKTNVLQKQSQFLRKVEDLIPASSSLVNELSDILETSTDSAYRRIRCETLLSIDEIIKLCDHFNITFDTFSKTENTSVTFTYSKLEPRVSCFKEYLEKLLQDMKTIENSSQKQIIYACEDIPVFHHYNHPILASFKMFYWMLTILNVPELEFEKFDTENINNELAEFSKKIATAYFKIPSIEIWTETTIHSTIKQIEYFWEAGKFKHKNDALQICEELRNEITIIQRQAEKGTKLDTTENKEQNFQLYFSDMEITNNCVYVNIGSLKSVYLGHFTFSTMSTFNDSYCEETLQWMNAIIKKSVLISGISEKQRYQVFKKYFKYIDELEFKIKNS